MNKSGLGVRNAALGALGFIGATAVAGGVEMVLAPHGNVFVKGEWLDHLPGIDSYVVPGLVLGVGLGGGSLLAAYGIWRRPTWRRLAAVERATGHHWALAATAAVGLALSAWLTAEILLIPERSSIEVLYAALAIGLLAACGSPSFRSWLSTTRHRS